MYKKSNKKFIEFISSGSDQDELMSRLLVGVSFTDKNIYISKLDDHQNIEQYKEIKDAFESLINKKRQ